MPELRSGTAGVLIMLYYMNVLLLSSEGLDVPTGSDITSCSMKCPDNSTVLSLYKVCGSNETLLVELWCNDMISSNVTEPRFYLNVSSGCWTLSNAKKSDSCNYTLRLDNSSLSTSFPLSTDVKVLDPESSLSPDPESSLSPDPEPSLSPDPEPSLSPDPEPSLSPDPGSSLSPDPGSSGNTTYVVLPVVGGIVLCLLPFFIVLDCKKKKLKDLESDGGNDHSEEHGGLSGSSPDADKEKTGQKNLMNVIGRIFRNCEYEETPQMEMEERTPVTAPGVAQN